MSDIRNFTFRIKEILTLEFSIKNIPEDISTDPDSFKFEVLPQLFIESNKFIGFNTTINVLMGKDNPLLICSLLTRISYEIINFEDFIDPQNSNSITIPDQFVHTLLSITLSTSRGILAAKTEGTILRNIYMPVMNPAGFKAKTIENALSQ
ncbi:hypothetical protein [Clostridium sp.]|uniref:hypothetical protein n=1 Tax=Clostridium sp. TaxID=1506 RepID=UPI00283C0D40|nr:hypothetical protein [Clostridium sp.]MDR3597216.1 hypothetical protein [Clostridium sp.]